MQRGGARCGGGGTRHVACDGVSVCIWQTEASVAVLLEDGGQEVWGFHLS